ncbi:hypothetical protein FHS42_003514 [Streptomyces zagrosensis]|uniref:Uncharacterized protein n=1 Tax=Streptomyces zagrosensis TaxID=1042984 RepID=A0A7W9QA90_9ACTN|nr:hypothetical protein [Streptomyces zagrosensis]
MDELETGEEPMTTFDSAVVHRGEAGDGAVCVRNGPVRDPSRSPSVWYLSLDTKIDRMFVYWDLRDVRCRQ